VRWSVEVGGSANASPREAHGEAEAKRAEPHSQRTLGQGWGSAQKPVIALLRAYLGRSRRSDAYWSRTGTGQCTGTGRSESLRRLAV
jgi:hypothetical protein